MQIDGIEGEDEVKDYKILEIQRGISVLVLFSGSVLMRRSLSLWLGIYDNQPDGLEEEGLLMGGKIRGGDEMVTMVSAARRT